MVFLFPPSQEFVKSPGFIKDGKVLWLSFEQESPEGQYETRSVCFQSVVAYKFTSEYACEPWMTKAYDRLLKLGNSFWLDQFRSNYRGENPDGLKHFVVYFDGYGFYEVIAQEFSVGV